MSDPSPLVFDSYAIDRFHERVPCLGWSDVLEA